MEKLLKDSADKIKAEDKTELETKIAELKTAKDASDLEALKKKLEETNEVAQKIGAAMYQQTAAEANSAGANQADSATDSTAGTEANGPVEGEIEEE